MCKRMVEQVMLIEVRHPPPFTYASGRKQFAPQITRNVSITDKLGIWNLRERQDQQSPP